MTEKGQNQTVRYGATWNTRATGAIGSTGNPQSQGSQRSQGTQLSQPAQLLQPSQRSQQSQSPLPSSRPQLTPQPFLPKKGNYRDLLVYKKAECIYDMTFFFTQKFLSAQKDRTVDQMVQAARSGKQNIAEGCAAAATSAETEIKLTNVARASMQELLTDYEDYLRVRSLTMWAVDDERTLRVKNYSTKHNTSADYMNGIEQRSDETIANIVITLIHQFDTMIGHYIARLQKDFTEQGGIRERMTASRLGYRNDQKAEIERLSRENALLTKLNEQLTARIAELEAKLKEK